MDYDALGHQSTQPVINKLIEIDLNPNTLYNYTYTHIRRMMYFTSEQRIDGFGAQYQTLIHMIYYAYANKGVYIHTPIKTIEHNYSNDTFYIKQLEELMCTHIFKTIDEITFPITEVLCITNKECRDYFDSNVDNAMSDTSMTSYKTLFWENIIHCHYNTGKFNIALHIRRGDVSHNYNEGRYTPNEYYLEKIAYLSEQYGDKDLLFHIYSEGEEADFACFNSQNVVLHLNEDVKSTFLGLVTSDVLVQAKSSFSYVAGLLSRGIVYHIPFWHPPLSSWIIHTDQHDADHMDF
jgi:hypothetical protein